MDPSFFEEPNEHYVGCLLRTSASKTIVATEDIYAARGIKLWARGQPISVSLRDRLVATRLKKPIEMCLQVEDGVTPADISHKVQQLLSSHPAISALAGNHASQVMQLIDELNLSGLPLLLLTTAAEDGSGRFDHAVLTALIAGCIALRLGMSEAAAEAAIRVGLLHDVGEMYVNPDCLRSPRDLSLDDWKNYAVHPRIGALLLSEFANYPPVCVRAIQEHHERLDGSGYPSGSSGAGISDLGQALMVTEVLSAILSSRENPEARALLALRLVPGQFAQHIVSLIGLIFKDSAAAMPAAFDPAALAMTARDIAEKLQQCDVEALRLERDSTLPAAWRAMADQTRVLCAILAKSLHSTGVMWMLEYPADALDEDPGIANELHVVITELKWRMRALSRRIALAASRWERAADVFAGLVRSLYIADIDVPAADQAP
jgi:HD-GYP domain-containing protein (c-di-GMP phosphodiesterase class II)